MSLLNVDECTSVMHICFEQGPGASLPPSGSKTSFARSMGLTGTQVGRHSFDEGTLRHLLVPVHISTIDDYLLY